MEGPAVNGEIDEEEIDVVEQVYGTSERLSWIDDTDLFDPPLSTAAKNRDIDVMAWSTTATASKGQPDVPFQETTRVKRSV